MNTNLVYVILGLLLTLAPVTRASAEATSSSSATSDIVELLHLHKIEVKTQGGGIRNVSLKVRSKTDGPLTVAVPVGTFFVSANSSAQNMVATGETMLTLNDREWHTLEADTACANRPRHIPEGGDHFSIQHAPNQKELAILMPVLDKAGVDLNTIQAAVWIVTDDADYDDLGILVAERNGIPIGRVINETEAARAMQVCDQAGLKLKLKAIWKDRKRILHGLGKGELKSWLEAKK